MRSPFRSVSKHQRSRPPWISTTRMRGWGSTRNSDAAPQSISVTSATPATRRIHASPIERAPFYALRIYPADLGTAIGLQTDRHARVLRNNGTVIAGLYACGNDKGSIMNE